MNANSFQARLFSVLLDGVPLISGHSIVRVAASAYRAEQASFTPIEFDRRLSRDGEVVVQRIGNRVFFVDHERLGGRRSAAKETV